YSAEKPDSIRGPNFAGAWRSEERRVGKECRTRWAAFAEKDNADGYMGLTKGIAKCLCQRLAIVVEIALSRNVVEVERIGVGVIGESGAVSDHDDKIARAQSLRDLPIVGVCRRCGNREQVDETDKNRQGVGD